MNAGLPRTFAERLVALHLVILTAKFRRSYLGTAAAWIIGKP